MNRTIRLAAPFFLVLLSQELNEFGLHLLVDVVKRYSLVDGFPQFLRLLLDVVVLVLDVLFNAFHVGFDVVNV